MSALVQNTPEWLQMRRNKIGASDAPIIMGVSPWRTPYQLWEEKLGIGKDINLNSYMQRGHDLEETARKEFERMTGLIVIPQVIQHPEYEWMIASLDGIDFCHKDIVEIKCPGREDHQTALEGIVPAKYYPQLQHQMEVTGLNKAYYFSFDGVAGKIIEVYRDDKYVEDLIKKELQFWRFMQDLDAPPMTERDYVERDDDLWNMASHSWLKCHKELQSLKAREEELRETLVALSGRSNSKGNGIKLSRVIRRGYIDYKEIPEIRHVDLEKYRKPAIETWRLSAHE